MLAGTPRIEEHEGTIVSCVCRSLSELEHLAFVMNRRDVASRMLVQVIRLARRTGCLRPNGIEGAIQRLTSPGCLPSSAELSELWRVAHGSDGHAREVTWYPA